VDMWVGTGDIEVVKGCAKIRLERKIALDWARKQRLRRMWGVFFWRIRSWLVGRTVRSSHHGYLITELFFSYPELCYFHLYPSHVRDSESDLFRKSR
jgi:hypothetical protein